MSSPLEERVLVLISSEKDVELCRVLLTRAGVRSENCPDLVHLCDALREGAAAVLLSEEWVNSPSIEHLLAILRHQPTWSELPILILAQGGADSRGAALGVQRLGNVTLLERPIRIFTLVTAIQTALRSRRRQYQIREHLRERQEAESALRESEERLRFSLDAGRLGFWQHDLTTDELICSDLCKAHFGRPPQEPLSHEEIVATVHPEDRDRVREVIRCAILEGEAYDVEYRVIWPDGSVHWVMIRGRARYNAAGKPVRTFGVTLDVTQRRNTELQQAAQAERLRLLSESAGHLLATEDPENMVGELFERVRQYVNLDLYLNYMVEPSTNTLRLVSYAGVPEGLVQQLNPLPSGKQLCAAAESRASLTPSNGRSWDDPLSAVMKELGMRAYTCNPLIVGDRLLGMLAFAVRDQDQFSEDQAEFLRTISHYVAFAKERVRVEEGLRDASRRKDEFLAMLAHELRNPLSPMANAIQIMRSRPGRTQGEKARDVLDRQLQHMSRLIDDLLDVSRINTGKITLKRERLDIVGAVERALESVRNFIAECGHTLETDLPPIPVYVDVDPVRLEQVIINLLNNAAKYTEKGGHIWVALDTDGTSARVRVRDTGIGIPPTLLGQVFDLFTQGERGLDRSQGGLGLGLTLVRNLVQLHGGTVEASSDGPGRGSEFSVTFPLAAAATPESIAPSPSVRPAETRAVPPPDSRSPRRLLVVDDNRDAAETLAELAQIWGFEVDTAYDGLAALERASEWEPAFVFLDIGMPGLSGYDVARRLRQDRRFEHVTLVALTGYGQDGDRERSRAAGFDHHLVKPVNVSELEKLLRSTSSSTGNGRDASAVPSHHLL